MGFLLSYLTSWLPFVSRKRYDEAVRLNSLAKSQLEQWSSEQRKWSRRNRLLLLHNATLKDMLLRRAWLEDTNSMVEQVQGMIGDMQGIVDDAREQEACLQQHSTTGSSG